VEILKESKKFLDETAKKVAIELLDSPTIEVYVSIITNAIKECEVSKPVDIDQFKTGWPSVWDIMFEAYKIVIPQIDKIQNQVRTDIERSRKLFGGDNDG
jgi:hypothetical protein